MSEWKWIDRREREPDPDQNVLVLDANGNSLVVRSPIAASRRYWMPIPPPPKMVTIEISEKAAMHFADVTWHQGLPMNAELSQACRKALEGN